MSGTVVKIFLVHYPRIFHSSLNLQCFTFKSTQSSLIFSSLSSCLTSLFSEDNQNSSQFVFRIDVKIARCVTRCVSRSLQLCSNFVKDDSFLKIISKLNLTLCISGHTGGSIMINNIIIIIQNTVENTENYSLDFSYSFFISLLSF